MKFLFEDGDIAYLTNVAAMPDDELLGEDEEYSPTYRAVLQDYQDKQIPLQVAMVDDHGDTVYLSQLIDGTWQQMFCFNAKYLKPSADTLDKLIKSML